MKFIFLFFIIIFNLRFFVTKYYFLNYLLLSLLFFVLLTGCKEDKDILAENGNEFITDSDYLTNETTGDSQAIVMQEGAVHIKPTTPEYRDCKSKNRQRFGNDFLHISKLKFVHPFII